MHKRYVSLHNFAAGTIQAVATWRLKSPISLPIRILKLYAMLCCTRERKARKYTLLTDQLAPQPLNPRCSTLLRRLLGALAEDRPLNDLVGPSKSLSGVGPS
jgi:hypothetical protein